MKRPGGRARGRRGRGASFPQGTPAGPGWRSAEGAAGGELKLLSDRGVGFFGVGPGGVGGVLDVFASVRDVLYLFLQGGARAGSDAFAIGLSALGVFVGVGGGLEFSDARRGHAGNLVHGDCGENREGGGFEQGATGGDGLVDIVDLAALRVGAELALRTRLRFPEQLEQGLFFLLLRAGVGLGIGGLPAVGGDGVVGRGKLGGEVGKVGVVHLLLGQGRRVVGFAGGGEDLAGKAELGQPLFRDDLSRATGLVRIGIVGRRVVVVGWDVGCVGHI